MCVCVSQRVYVCVVSDWEESSFSDFSPLTCLLSRLLSSSEQSMGRDCSSIWCILGVFLLLQLTAYNSLQTTPHLIIHILFSINTLEIGSGTVARWVHLKPSAELHLLAFQTLEMKRKDNGGFGAEILPFGNCKCWGKTHTLGFHVHCVSALQSKVVTNL